MERQAIRRVDQDDLTEEQIEKIGTTLMALEDRMTELREHFGLSPDLPRRLCHLPVHLHLRRLPLLAIPAGSAAALTPRATLVDYIKNIEDLPLCGRGAPCPR